MLSVCVNAGKFSGYKRFSNKQNGSSNPNFGRALTSDERKISNIVLERANQINGVDLRAMILPGAAVPAYHMKDKTGNEFLVDTGVGSPFSKAAQDQILFSKDLMGINAIQQLPMGGIAPQTQAHAQELSPFSASPFEKGTQLVDPSKIHEMGLVDVEDVKKFNIATQNDKYNNYDNYFEKNREFFEKAHNNFKVKIQEDAGLKKQYDEFLNHETHSEWVEKKAVTSALMENLYWHSDFIKWDRVKEKANPNCQLEMNGDIDKRLFSVVNNPRAEEAKNRLEEIKKDSEIKKSMDFYKFTQFIAHKQAQEHYKFMQDNDIKNIADVPIGVSKLDVHAFPDAFMLDFDAKTAKGFSTMGCFSWGKPVDWDLPALKPKAKESKDLVKLKYKTALDYADTSRIDAAWQLVEEHVNHHYDIDQRSDCDDSMGKDCLYAIKEAFEELKKGSEIKNIVAENVGEGKGIAPTNEILNELGIPKIVKSGAENLHKEPLNSPISDYATFAIHDDESLIDQVKNIKDQDLNGKSRYEARNDAWANLDQGQRGDVGPRRVQYMFSDLFGIKDRYNNCRDFSKFPESTEQERKDKYDAIKQEHNWDVRTPQNFEESYYKNLAGEGTADGEKFGKNAHKTTKRAMQYKGIIGYPNNKLTNNSQIKDAKIVAELMEHFESVLEEKGVYTTEAANKKQGDLMKGLNEKFGEKAVKVLLNGYDKLANKKLENKDAEYEKMMLEFEQAVNEHKAKNKSISSSNSDSKGSKIIDDALDNKASNKLSKTNKILFAVGLGVAALGGGIALYKKSLDKDKAKNKKPVVKIQEKLPETVPPKVSEPVKQKNTVVPQKTNAKMQDKNTVVMHTNAKKSPQTHASNKNRNRNINLSA